MLRGLAYVVTAILLGACASRSPPGGEAAPVPVLMLGEQHDAPEHQRLHRDAVDALARRGALAAVVIEMAQQGRSTLGLPPDADDERVRQALGWDARRGWDWRLYGPAVMAAVHEGVPVFGANIGDDEMRSARGDDSLDSLIPPEALRLSREAIRSGHCDLLPAAQLAPMARIQIARDRSMARALESHVTPGKTVVLIAGSGHVDPRMGVPLHLPRTLHADPVMLPRVETGQDYCGELRRQMPSGG